MSDVTKKHRSLIGSFLGGGVSAFASTTALQPLDVLKTRVQEAAIRDKIQRGIPDISAHIFKTQGLLGFWSGLTASLWRNIPGIALYFSTLNALMSGLGVMEPNRDRHSSFVLAAAAASSRCLAATILFPFTFIKTRYESRTFSYGGIRDAFRIILEKEGRSVVFRGYLPTMARDIPFSAIYFPIYSNMKLFCAKVNPDFAQSTVGHFCCGCLAGTAASIITQPADVLKTHMQLEPSKFTTIYRTTRWIIKTDGFIGLFRGSTLRIARRTIITAINWSIFESVVGDLTPAVTSRSS